MGKITLLEHMKACAEAARSWTDGRIGDIAGTVAEVIEELDENKADRTASTSVTISADGWQTDDSALSYPYYYDIADSSVTAADHVSVTILPEYVDIAASCQMCPTCESMSGVIRLRAKTAPMLIKAAYWIHQGKE